MGDAAEKQSEGDLELGPGLRILSDAQITKLVRDAVAMGIEQAMEKLDRARASEVMNTKEMATHLNKTERTLANWIKKGMPHFFVGAERRFKRGEVEEWLKTFKG